MNAAGLPGRTNRWTSQRDFGSNHVDLVAFSEKCRNINQFPAKETAYSLQRHVFSRIVSPEWFGLPTNAKIVVGIWNSFDGKLLSGGTFKWNQIMGQSVLIVEHDPAVLDHLSMCVKECEIKVHCADDLESAMSKLRNHRLSIAIVNWELPENQATEIIDTIRGNHRMRRMHIIVLSTKTDPSVVEEAMSRGANDFFSMPIGTAEIRSRLLWACSRTQQLM
jgi:CheY-like chemotaxis protein